MADNTDLQLAYSVLDTEGKGEITYHGLESLFKSLGKPLIRSHRWGSNILLRCRARYETKGVGRDISSHI